MGSLSFEHIDNVRDLGGFATHDGYIVRNHKLLRTASLSDASDADLRRLTEVYEIGHVIDLRATVEHNTAPDPELSGIGQVHIPLMSANALGVAIKDGNWTEMLRGRWRPDDEDVCLMYRSFVDEQTKDRWRNIFHVVLNTNVRSLLVHCTNGKDRTGVVCAVILLALGVSREDVMADYIESNNGLLNRRREIFDSAARSRSETSMMDRAGALLEAKPIYLQAALDHIDQQYGDLNTFLEEVCGLGVAEDEHLRNLYLQ